MLIGNYPVADTLESDDILIISKDGVHLMQISAYSAGVGGGLRWWKETETRIEHEKSIGGSSGVSTGQDAWIQIHGGEPFLGKKWCKHYYTEAEMVQNATYSACKASGLQPETENGTPLYTGDIWYEEDPTDMSASTLMSRQTVTIINRNEIASSMRWETNVKLPYQKAFPHVYFSRGSFTGYLNRWTQQGVNPPPSVAQKASTSSRYNEVQDDYGRALTQSLVTSISNDPGIPYNHGGEENPNYIVSCSVDGTLDDLIPYDLPYLFLVTCVGQNYNVPSTDFEHSFATITSDKIDPEDQTHYTGQAKVTRGTNSILGAPRKLVNEPIFTDTKTGDRIDYLLGLPEELSVYVHHDDSLWNVMMIPLWELINNKYTLLENWQERILINGEPIGEVPNFLGNLGTHPALRTASDLEQYVETCAMVNTGEYWMYDHLGQRTDNYCKAVNVSQRLRPLNGDTNGLVDYVVANARAVGLDIIKDRFKLHAYNAQGGDGSANDSYYTNIGVEESEGFRTGIKREIIGQEESVLEIKAMIDPATGKGAFGKLFEGGPTVDKAVPLNEKYQLKLVAGEGIHISNQDSDDESKPRVISSSVIDDINLILRQHLSAGMGLSLTEITEGLFTYAIDHEVKSLTNSEGYYPVYVARSNVGNHVEDKLGVELSGLRAALNFPQFLQGTGITLTGLNDYTSISSYAITQFRVNNQILPITDLPAAGTDRSQRYVNLDTSEWGGGGGGSDASIPSPVPDYAKRKIVTKFFAVNHVFTAPEDGYLFLEIRNSAVFYCKLGIEDQYYTIGNMNEATNKQVFSDSSNMVPLYKGQKVTLVEKTSGVNISTSTSATNVDRFWFIPMVRQGAGSDTFTLGYYLYSTNPVDTISASSIKTDGAADPYVYTPSADCAIVTDVNNLKANNLYIYPLDGDDQPLGQYILGRCYNVSTTAQRFNNGQILLKKGQKYRITKSSSSTTENYYIYNLNYVLKSNYDNWGSLWSPFLDWANAEVINLESGYDYTWVDIPAPVKTETPGILYIDGTNAYAADYAKGVQLQFGSGNDGKTRLFYKSDTSGRNYIRVPGYNAAYASTKWKYYKDFDSLNPLKLVFVPFMEYKKPGVEHVVVDHEFIDDNGIVDLSYLYNKIADLEARVEALENPT